MDVSSFACFLAKNALNSHAATEVLDVISCLNQDMTLNMDAVGSVLFGKGLHKDVAVLQLDHMIQPPFLGAGGRKRLYFSCLKLASGQLIAPRQV